MAFLIGTSSNDNLTSIVAGANWGLEADLASGLGGNDMIETGANADILEGNAGNDLLFGGSGNDELHGGADNDQLADGSGDDRVYGGAGDDTVTVNNGDDVYAGGSGTDTLEFYYFEFNGAFSFDPADQGARFDLARTGVQNLGQWGFDRFAGFENILGSDADDRFLGSAGANSIAGRAGNDTIDGRAGNDTIAGSEGADVLIGGMGLDHIYTFRSEFNLDDDARDIVRFRKIAESGATLAIADVIEYFVSKAGAGGDRIDLSAIDADPAAVGNQAFSFLGTGAFTSAPGEVRYSVSGGDVIVRIDTDGDSAAEMVILVKGLTALSAADFIL
jgi:Ca2+-binding RTX toxin-like protein